MTQWDAWEKRHQKPPRDGQLHRGASEATTGLGSPGLTPPSASGETNADLNSGSDQGFTVKELEMMEKLLGNLRGNLGKPSHCASFTALVVFLIRLIMIPVTFPTRFLESEAISGNHLFARDRIQPMAVYVSTLCVSRLKVAAIFFGSAEAYCFPYAGLKHQVQVLGHTDIPHLLTNAHALHRHSFGDTVVVHSKVFVGIPLAQILPLRS